MNFIMSWFKPPICFRKYYTMDKFNCNDCQCILKCKYPPPSKMVPIKNEINVEKVKFKYTHLN